MARSSFVEHLLPRELFEDAAVALEDFFELRNSLGKPISSRWLTTFVFYFQAIAKYQSYRLFDYLSAIPISGANGGQSVNGKVVQGGSYIPGILFASNHPLRFTPNGGAVPGDRIVGIWSPGEGFTIYPIQSPELKQFESEPGRWFDLRWHVDDEARHRYPAEIAVQAANELGTLALIRGVLAQYDCNIGNVRTVCRSPNFIELTIDLAVYDLKHLNAILSHLQTMTIISDAKRVIG